MKNRIVLAILTTMFGVTVILFATGAPILTKDLFGIPAGNIILWMGFISLQLLCYLANRGFKKSASSLGKLIRVLMIFLIIVSLLWFAIAYILSGNTSFNFSSSATTYLGSPKASVLYWIIIYALAISPIVLVIIYKILRFFELRKARSKG